MSRSIVTLRIGIDLGGTKIEALALAPGGVELLRRRIGAPRDDYQATLGAIAALVAGVETELGARGSIGIGHPGTISPATGVVKNSNSTWLNGQPLDRDLSRLLDRPLRLANDANCFALSEATDGAGAGANVVFGVIAGTGTGGGIVVNGQVVTGVNAIAGEWGHNPMPWPAADEWPGPPCYCGRTGCIETFLSGPAVARDYERAGGEPVAALDIARRAADGETRAQACIERLAERMARSLASIINVLDPHVIVLGGGLSNIAYLYHRVPTLWNRFVFSDDVATKLAPAAHGDSSGVRGAAWLWTE
jgi:fructokinase